MLKCVKCVGASVHVQVPHRRAAGDRHTVFKLTLNVPLHTGT